MTPETYERMWQLYDKALSLEPSRRQAFLDEHCAGDPGLQAELEKLLVQADAGRATPAPSEPCPCNVKSLLSSPSDNPLIGKRIGPYQVRELIGSGGMANVYLAIRVEDYKQQVAIKLIKRGMDTDDILRRFQIERQVLAGLSHPNIARLLDGGNLEGQPYFVMEYIEGTSIDQYCNARRLDTAGRLQLFRSVCAAVHHAHQNRVFHRDLKPGNVLVGADGLPKLLDFGIAKLLNPEAMGLPDNPTRPGDHYATLEYASPEQVKGAALPKVASNVASDVYSLGVVLYELLTGHRPHEMPGRTGDEIDRIRSGQEPTLPRQWQPKLARDLQTICLKCLVKDPARRYGSPKALAEDVERYLCGEPIRARRTGSVERAWRWAARNPVVAFSLLAVISIASFLAMKGLRPQPLPRPPPGK